MSKLHELLKNTDDYKNLIIIKQKLLEDNNFLKIISRYKHLQKNIVNLRYNNNNHYKDLQIELKKLEEDILDNDNYKKYLYYKENLKFILNTVQNDIEKKLINSIYDI